MKRMKSWPNMAQDIRACAVALMAMVAGELSPEWSSVEKCSQCLREMVGFSGGGEKR